MKKSEYLPSLIPAKPGVYVFRDRFKRVIYVGKAANLRRRLGNYFQPARAAHADAKTRSLINSIDEWSFELVRNEDEALILESRLIKEYAPRYNILMRDDKRYPLLKIDLRDPYPTLKLARVEKPDKAEYFGPFPNGGALRRTLDFLLQRFRLRTCKDVENDEEARRRCLKRAVNDCSAPCVGRVSREEYARQVAGLMEVLNGDIDPLLDELDSRMAAAAENTDFEKAASLRDVKANLIAVFGRKNRKFARPELPDSPAGMAGVTALQEALGIDRAPRVIIGFDISNIMGTLAVSSLVCFRDGRPDKAQYRHFRIRTVDHSDDFAMMAETLRRHFSRLLDEHRPLPDLIMVDGGKGQLSAALAALQSIGCPPIPMIGLAKREEEIFLPYNPVSVKLDRHHPGLRMLQALRDEAHRFAISYHRELRRKRLEQSLLDDVPGIGRERKKLLLQEFGSVRALKRASAADIERRVRGFGRIFAQKVFDFLHR